MMRKTGLLFLLLLAPALLWGKRIEIRSQADFDLLQHSVDAVLASGIVKVVMN